MPRQLLFMLGLLIAAVSIHAQQNGDGITVIGQAGSEVALFRQNGTRILARDGRLHIPLDSQPGGRGVLYHSAVAGEFEHSDYRLMFWDGAQHIELTTAYTPNCPPYFAPGGTSVYYVGDEPLETIAIEGDPFSQYLMLPVYQREVAADAVPQQVGRLRFFTSVAGGGFGSSYPAAYVTIRDVSSHPSFALIPHHFRVTDTGVVAAPDCQGGTLTMTTSDDIIETDIIPSATISPDGRTVASITNFREIDTGTPQMTLLDLQTLQRRNIPLDHTARSFRIQGHQLHWAQDGNIYYTTTLTIPENEADYLLAPRQALQELVPGMTYRFSDVTLHRFNPQTETTEAIYTAPDTFAILRLQSTPDALYWSQVSDSTQLLDEYQAGWQPPENWDFFSRESTPAFYLPDVYQLRYNGIAPERIAENIRQFVPVPAVSEN